MKDWEYNVTLVLSILCLGLSIWIISAGRANGKLQAQFQLQQVEIERGNVSRQVGSRILQDMMAMGATNQSIHMVLEKCGFIPPGSMPAVNVKPADKPAQGNAVRKGPAVEGKPKGKSSKNAVGK